MIFDTLNHWDSEFKVKSKHDQIWNKSSEDPEILQTKIDDN